MIVSEMTANDLRRIELEIEYETVAPPAGDDAEQSKSRPEEENVTVAHS